MPAAPETVACGLRAWLANRGTSDGPLFLSRTGRRLSGRDVARILQRRAAEADLAVLDLGAHSLRAGLVTQAARAGKPDLPVALDELGDQRKDLAS